jgi:membrane associated rhomboid family serine protease
MSTQRRKSVLSYIPGYTNNAVLQLIIASGVAFCILGVSWGIIKIIYQGDETPFNTYFIQNIALPPLSSFKAHWWTFITYGWFHFNGFWELLSNMLWLYCFGSVVQMLVGHKQVIPLFAYSIITGGIFYLVAQLLPGEWGKIPHVVGLLGPRAALMAMAAAAITLTPKYRFYLTETFSIPIMVAAGIFAALMILGSGFYLPIIILLAAGAGTGYGYIKLLQAGYRPGEWMYIFKKKVESLVTPDENAVQNRRNRSRYGNFNKQYEPKQGITQKRIDDILDKINQKGYNSLSAEEKDTLMKAGKQE